MKVKFTSFYILVITFLCSFFLSENVQAQEINKAYVDSILLIASTNNFKTKEDVIGTLCKNIRMYDSQKVSALYSYLDSINQDKEIKVLFYKYWGTVLSRTGEVEKSNKIRYRGLALAKELEITYLQFDYNRSLAMINIIKVKPDSASFYINEAEEIIKRNPKQLNHVLWDVYNIKASVQRILGNTERQGEWLEKTWTEIDKDSLHSSRGFILTIITDYYRSKTSNYERQSFFTELLVDY